MFLRHFLLTLSFVFISLSFNPKLIAMDNLSSSSDSDDFFVCEGSIFAYDTADSGSLTFGASKFNCEYEKQGADIGFISLLNELAVDNFFDIRPWGLVQEDRNGFTSVDGSSAEGDYPFVPFVRGKSDCVTLYRGIDPTAGLQRGRSLMHEAIFIRAIMPYDPIGHKDPSRHHAGTNFSQFTSWTPNRLNACVFAAEKGGVVVCGNFHLNSVVQSPNDKYAEKEVLVHGVVYNFKIFVLSQDISATSELIELVNDDLAAIQDHVFATGSTVEDAIKEIVKNKYAIVKK